MVADIDVGSWGSSPYSLTAVGSTLFFIANDGTHGGELWKSDGTGAGTVLVRDINPGPANSTPSNLLDVSGTLFFIANDGTHGGELWKSDGTEDGTTMVKDINPGVDGGAVSCQPCMWLFNGLIYLLADDGVHGEELWRSDGTDAGTVLIRDIKLGSASSFPYPLVRTDNTLLFGADDGVTGRELWKSDGTEQGTALVKDIKPGSLGSELMGLTSLGGTVFFSAAGSTGGIELWKSDGTAGGTVLVQDIRPGNYHSEPRDFRVVNGALLFFANDGTHGRELWRVESKVSPTLDVPATALQVGGTTTLTGTGFTAGTVIKLYVATATGAVAYGPYPPESWSSTALTWDIPATVPLGNGFGSVQVVNTDQGYTESNVVGALLEGDPLQNIPTLLYLNGEGLGPADPSIAVAHIDTVLAKGSTVTLTGTGFASPGVNLFTATGNVGPLWPVAGWTATQFQVQVPVTTPTGPGNFQVVNSPYTGNVQSNAVSAVIGARPTITGVTVNGATVTVTGTGFCSLSVINLFNQQGATVVNLGGLAGTTAKVPLTLVNDTQFTFTLPAGAVAGPAFVEVLNPPYIPFASSGNDPDGAFTIP